VNFGQWLGFFSLLTSLYILWQIRQLLLLAFTAVVLAIALNRFVGWLQQFRLRRQWAIVITLILILILTIVFFWLVVPPFTDQFQELIQKFPKVWERVRVELLLLKQQQLRFDWLPPLPSQEDLIKQIQPVGTELFKNFFAFFSNSFTAILQFLLVFILTLMMLANPLAYRRAFLTLFPSFYRRRADVVLSLSEAALGNWLMGTCINCLFIGILSGVWLLILQIKLVLVHAVLAGLLNFIPNIGPTASVIFPITIALLDAPWKIWLILLGYFVIQNIESYWLTPRMMAEQVSLLPAITLMAQLFFAQAFGVLGLLLALPLAVVAKTWLEEMLFKDILDKWVISPHAETVPPTTESHVNES
jgi:predicted PurR-regulated permease PerM